MKKYFYTLIMFSFILNFFNLNAKDDENLLGEVAINNSYYISIPPIPGKLSETEVNLFFNSSERCKLTIWLDDNIVIVDTIVANQTKKISLPAENFIFFENENYLSQKSEIYKNKAIHIFTCYHDEQVIYVQVKNKSFSGMFEAIYTVKSGNKYLVSSMNDNSDNVSTFAPSFTAITGVYDNTKVTFELKGNKETSVKIADSIIYPGEKVRYTLFEGDVLYIPSNGSNADLTGSIITSNKPVIVASGNYCAKINSSDCDYIIENEKPENLWGSAYYVPPIADRNESYLLRIFANKLDVNIYKNGEKIGVIDTGFIELKIDDEIIEPIVISTDSDSKINVVQYGSGKAKDRIDGKPFQMNIASAEQFGSEASFNTPDVNSQTIFDSNFVNIIYIEHKNHNSDSLEIGEIINGELFWSKINQYDLNSIEHPFKKIDGSDSTFISKTIKLRNSGTYRIRSVNKKEIIAVYVYGFGKDGSYAYASSNEFYGNDIPDTLAPVIEFHKHCDGSVSNGLVTDEPRNDDYNRANLGLVGIDLTDTYNYEFEYNDFVIGEDKKTTWSLSTFDPLQPAKAHLFFMDRVGNRLDTIIEYHPMLVYIRADDNTNEKDFGKFEIKTTPDEMTYEFEIANISKSILPDNHQVYLIQDSKLKDYWKKDDIFKDTHFEIIGIGNENLAPLEALEKIKFQVKFTAKEIGVFEDNLGLVIKNHLKDTCVYQYFVKLTAKVEFPISVENQIENNTLILYPNPVSEKINIHSNESLLGATIKITDILGNVTYAEKINIDKLNCEIDIKEYAKGTYYIQIIYNNGKIINKVFIK